MTELSKDELGRIIDGALADAKSKVEESIEAQIEKRERIASGRFSKSDWLESWNHF